MTGGECVLGKVNLSLVIFHMSSSMCQIALVIFRHDMIDQSSCICHLRGMDVCPRPRQLFTSGLNTKPI